MKKTKPVNVCAGIVFQSQCLTFLKKKKKENTLVNLLENYFLIFGDIFFLFLRRKLLTFLLRISLLCGFSFQEFPLKLVHLKLCIAFTSKNNIVVFFEKKKNLRRYKKIIFRNNIWQMTLNQQLTINVNVTVPVNCKWNYLDKTW